MIQNKFSLSHVAIVYNTIVNDSLKTAQYIQESFNVKGIKSSLYLVFELAERISKDVTFVIVIGGDGTILSTSRKLAHMDIPIFGINLGHLGFLSQTDIKDLDIAIDFIIKEKIKIESRNMLEIEFKDEKVLALNDAVVKASEISCMCELFLRIENDIIGNYFADGVIISTATGSTAYTLSAGGPIIHPCLDVTIITPICPHTLSVRPIVIPSEQDIYLKAKTRMNDKIFITSDGQEHILLENSEEVKIKKAKINAKIASLDLPNINFYTTLSDKLKWNGCPII